MKEKIVSPHTVLMIEPVAFGFNEEAFETNKFQQKPEGVSAEEVQKEAQSEFNDFVDLLRRHDVEVLVYKDTLTPHTPDSIFPNNWISTHLNGMIVTYPMQPANRRLERRKDIIDDLFSRFRYTSVVSLEGSEQNNPPTFLEGTGSIVFDHQNKIAYGAISPRTDRTLLEQLARQIDYTAVPFTAYGSKGELIYHTNVMLCVGETFVVIGENTIDEKDKPHVLKTVRESGKEIISLTNEQVYHHFAGNMLQLRNGKNETILVMSKAAKDSLTKEQLRLINLHNDHLVAPDLSTIEKVGGGSARCMLAEVILPESA